MKTLQIGNIKLKNNLVLAPISGMTDTTFRSLVKEFGCSLVCTGLISSEALIRNHPKTFELLKYEESEHPLAIQIFGSNPSVLAEAGKIIEFKGADIVDINMGCSIKKVLKTHSGSFLLKNLNKAKTILEKVVDSVSIPVTIKIRAGWDKTSINAIEIAKMAEDSGISAVTIHGRTANQGFEEKSDWKIIKDVKEHVSISVIGNGDVKSPMDADKMVEETGCDGIMIGREALGNPWIFSDILYYRETGKIPLPPSGKERCEIILKHLFRLIKSKGEKRAIKEMRKHIFWYTKGLPHASKFRAKINRIEEKEILKGEIERYFLEILNGFSAC